MREAAARDDLLELAADMRGVVIDGDAVALARELPGRREAGDAAADDGDGLSRVLRGRSDRRERGLVAEVVPRVQPSMQGFGQTEPQTEPGNGV